MKKMFYQNCCNDEKLQDSKWAILIVLEYTYHVLRELRCLVDDNRTTAIKWISGTLFTGTLQIKTCITDT